MAKTGLLASVAFGALVLAGGAARAATAAAATTGTAATVGELVVTAERRTENIQSVPVAISAFSQEKLKAEKIEGGEGLLTQIPNANYTRGNFGGYNFKIRGIGTDVVTFLGTAGVSVNENELPLTTNHFQDTEFYDTENVEVFRGPQGTLFGRNATGGAVDVITRKPTDKFEGYIDGEYGNYDTIKVQGAINIPLGSAFAFRFAGFRWYDHGYGFNSFTDKRVDGRDLGGFRATLSFKPSDKFDAYLLAEYFNENDNRNRVGKQLCIKDPGPSSVGGVVVPAAGGPVNSNYAAFLNQGCIPGSLYQDAAYGTLNSNGTLAGVLANLGGFSNGTDLFANHPLQDRNLHDIESALQPQYQANQYTLDLHMNWHLTDELTLESITGYNREIDTNAEDYNRIVPHTPFAPVATSGFGPLPLLLFPNGVIQDPQTGTSNLLNSFDYGDGQSVEYTQELRLVSSSPGRLNFLAGAFYSELDTHTTPNDYYVESSSLTGFSLENNLVYDLTYWGALAGGANAAAATAAAQGAAPLGGLIYIQPGYPPNGTGHNYYDARGGLGHLKSYAGFGEVYYNIMPDLKLTLGGRYTVDQLLNYQFPIELLSASPNNGPVFTDPGFPLSQYPGLGPALGFPNGIPGTPDPAYGGFPQTICATSTVTCVVPQRVTFREFTGRAVLEWTPKLNFTDQTMVYASYSRGYKGGGFNTPCQASLGVSGGQGGACGYPLSFLPEFINAFEIGTKNTLLGGALTLNGDFFYYDYSNYQISRIVSESSVNENINAREWGLEFEGRWTPVRNLELTAIVGYLNSSITGGTSIDSLNLTQGNPNYTVVKQTGGQNCLAPTADVAAWIAAGQPAAGLGLLCAGIPGTPFAGSGANQFGIPVDLNGKKLPNTPPWTVALGATYTLNLTNDWSAILHGDWYWQDSSWARIYNAINDRLQSYDYVNATLTFHDEPLQLDVQFFVKNLTNAQPITGTYVTDPTSGLFQNVFTLDPRTYGVEVTKHF
ncbi:MAG TPA: TonB-dependent receptor [Caulobacteraceae bacterium]|nr:TonB-dependent receptor [Caulobacteraceae bacterium]